MIVIAKTTPINSHTTKISGVIRNTNPKPKFALVGKFQHVYSYRRHQQTVNESPSLIDAQKFQQTILIPIVEPPLRRVDAADITKIARTDPVRKLRII